MVFSWLFKYEQSLRVYNKRNMVVEDSMHVTFDESYPPSIKKYLVDDDIAMEKGDEELQNGDYKQDDLLCENQEEQQEEQAKLDQNEGHFKTLPNKWRYVSSYPKI